MDFVMVMPGEKSILAVSAVALMEMGTFLGNVLTSLWFKYVKIISFTVCYKETQIGLIACIGMAGCLRWTSVEEWAVGPCRVAAEDWVPADDFAAEVRGACLAAQPDVWTDGSLVRDEVSGVCCFGAGVYALASGSAWCHRSWGHLDLLPLDVESGAERCRLYFSVPGPLQTVQRAELWEVKTALQASMPAHFGVDNLNVVN